jgi:hypothetical protein
MWFATACALIGTTGNFRNQAVCKEAIATLTRMRSLPMTTLKLERFVKCATEEKKQRKMTIFLCEALTCFYYKL